MKIDPKSLIPLDLKNLFPGITFYRKESENDYAKCVSPTEGELLKMSEHEKWTYFELTKKYSAQNRLFVNISKPGKNFL